MLHSLLFNAILGQDHHSLGRVMQHAIAI